jgi:ABC-type bacteriocin/lantibiotic exporter with double-glycine peptidase domain
MEFPDVRQRRDCDCSAACAKAVEEHYGVVRPLAHYSNGLSVERASGCDPRTIERFFRKAGYLVTSGEMTLEDMRYHTARHRPIITPVTSNGLGHYVVVYRVSDRLRTVYFQDPWDGPRKMPAAEFEPLWVDCDEDSTYRQWGIAISVGG